MTPDPTPSCLDLFLNNSFDELTRLAEQSTATRAAATCRVSAALRSPDVEEAA